jgi:cell division septation protein DedD
MAPIPDPAPARMAPIPDPEPQRPIFTAGKARAYPSDTVGSNAVFTPTEGFAQDEAAPGPDQGDRTLASLLPAGAASGSMRSRAVEARPIEAPQRPAAPRYAAMAPRGDAVSPARFGPIGSAAHARANPPVAMRWVAGPAPAVILSDASSGEGAQSYDGGPTLQPTLASVRSSQPAAQQAARSFDAAGRSGGVYIQAGAFLSDRNAEALRAQLASYGRADVLTTNVGGKLFHRVRIGPMASASEAERALAKLRQIGHPEAHIVPQ